MSENFKQPPETVALVNWLVNPISPEQTSNELLDWQLPFYATALGGLRRIAGIPEDQALPPDFQPSPTQGAVLYRELAYDRKAYGMFASLSQYITDYKSGDLQTQLRDSQKGVMDALSEAIMSMGLEQQINVKSPTGSGKTVIFAKLIEGLKYKEQSQDRVRALILLHSKDTLHQTVEAFRNFTDIEPAAYYGGSKEIGEVTAMTYHSFPKAWAQGKIDRSSFDIVVKDESDIFYKGKTRELIDEYCADPETGRRKVTVGLTGTLRKEQTAIYERSVIESIGSGDLAPLSTYQRFTNASVIQDEASSSEKKDYSQKEIEHLMDDKERNAIIVQEVMKGVSSGRRVLVRCVPGKNLEHPSIIKELLLQQGKISIPHPYMGDIEHRFIRPYIITGNMNDRHRRLITEAFNDPLADAVDVLLFVNTLTRGFNSPVAKTVINGSPTRSLNVAEQLLGRITRWYEAHNGNVIAGQAIDIVDKTDRGQATFEEVINRSAPKGTRYKKGAIIGPGLANLRTVESPPGSAFEPIS